MVTVNGGRSWSSWYNQPTGQFYHLAADDRFPYWIYSGQQDSGTVGIASRSDYGAIDLPRLASGRRRRAGLRRSRSGRPGHRLRQRARAAGSSRFDGRTGQVAERIALAGVEPTRSGPTDVKYRYTWITPIAVSPRPPHAIYQGAQVLFRSDDGGHCWEIDQPRPDRRAVRGTKGARAAITLRRARRLRLRSHLHHRALAASRRRDLDRHRQRTDPGDARRRQELARRDADRLLDLEQDRRLIDASPLDPATAYAAVDRHRLDDFTPHRYAPTTADRRGRAIATGLPPRRVRAGRPGRSGEPRAALRGHEPRRLRLVRRRRPLAAACS